MKYPLKLALCCALVLAGLVPVQAAPPHHAGIRGLENASLRVDGAWVVRQRISGTGAIHAAHIVVEGKVSPGNSPGCINFGGDVTFNSGAVLLIEIGGATPCNEHDKIIVANRLTLNNPTLQVVLIDGFAPQRGHRFDMMDWGIIEGSFGNIDISAAALPAGLQWDYAELYSSGELVIGVPDNYQVPVPNAAIVLLFVLLVTVKARFGGASNRRDN